MTKNTPRPLFEYGVSEWEEATDLAFDAFLVAYRFNNRSLRESSFVIYKGMFARMKHWVVEQGLSLFELKETELGLFLDSRSLSRETRHRYLLFFRTLFEHLTLIKAGEGALDVHAESNPAHVMLLSQEAPAREEPAWLSEVELKAVLACLPEGKNWKRLRDRAMIGMVVGAGLRTSEVLNLKASELNFKGGMLESVWVPPHKPKAGRQVPVQSFALELISPWLAERASLRATLNGPLLFTSTLVGAALKPVTLFRLVKGLLEKAGIQKRYEGATLLRNTCGALWLKKHEPWQVMQFMGHATVRTTEMLLPSEISVKMPKE